MEEKLLQQYNDMAWYLLTEHLTNFGEESLIIINDIMGIFTSDRNKWQQKNTIKKKLQRKQIPYYEIKDARMSDYDEHKGTPMPVYAVLTQQVCVKEVYVVRMTGQLTKKERLILVCPKDLQRFIVISHPCVSERLVNLINNATQYMIQ